MSSNKRFIVVIGWEGYGDPFKQFAKIASSFGPLTDKKNNVLAVIFTGGEDVCPSLYGGKDCGLSDSYPKRDKIEQEVFLHCKKHNIKMIGICRGLQFLNVMAGGSMFQHVHNHAGVYHEIFYPALNRFQTVNSLHHQMIELAKDAIPIAWAKPKLSKWGSGFDGHAKVLPDREIEAAIFPKDNAIGVQFHPEIMRKKDGARIFFVNMVQSFLSSKMEDFVSKYGYSGA
jgi:gamma-glutamyl-gamma-aminobutyrate hydrolase PuuD